MTTSYQNASNHNVSEYFKLWGIRATNGNWSGTPAHVPLQLPSPCTTSVALSLVGRSAQVIVWGIVILYGEVCLARLICFNMPQYGPVCFDTRQYALLCINMLQYASISLHVLQYSWICLHVLQYASVCLDMPPYVSICFNMRPCASICLNVPQHVSACFNMQCSRRFPFICQTGL